MKTKERVAKIWKYDSTDHHHVCAMHEAGHAIANVLSISEMGYDISKAIHSIEMKMASDWSVAQGMPQATTYAHTFSREIQVAAAHFVKACIQDHGELRLQEYPTIIKLARASGADIERWFRTRAFTAVSGAVAEALFSGQSFHDVWESEQCKGDQENIMLDAAAADMLAEKLDATIDQMGALAAFFMEDPSVWEATCVLARKLPRVGRMSGERAVRIVTSELKMQDFREAFAEKQRELAELGSQIEQAEIVIPMVGEKVGAIIKGKDKALKAKEAGQQQICSTTICCKHPVFGEMLWRAFGDGNR